MDLGCGPGETSARLVRKSILRRFNTYIVGLDINIVKLNVAKKVLNDVVLGDASNPPFRSGSFDMVFMIEVLDHLPKHKGLRLLRILDDLYKIGIIITCPNGSTPKVHNHELEYHIWDRHHSDWYPLQLRWLKYNVITVVPRVLVALLGRFLNRPFLVLQLLMPFLNLINLPDHVVQQIVAWKVKKVSKGG